MGVSFWVWRLPLASGLTSLPGAWGGVHAGAPAGPGLAWLFWVGLYASAGWEWQEMMLGELGASGHLN